jgi:hypothetical protein
MGQVWLFYQFFFVFFFNIKNVLCKSLYFLILKMNNFFLFLKFRLSSHDFNKLAIKFMMHAK